MGCGASTAAQKYSADGQPVRQPTESREEAEPDPYPHLPMSHVATLIQCFEMLDLDDSGSIDTAEFNSTTTDESMRELFKFLDSAANSGNMDGQIQLDEWLDGWNRMGEKWSSEELERRLLQVRWMRENARLFRARAIFDELDAEAQTGSVPRGPYRKRLKADPKLHELGKRLGKEEDFMDRGDGVQAWKWVDIEAVIKPSGELPD